MSDSKLNKDWSEFCNNGAWAKTEFGLGSLPDNPECSYKTEGCSKQMSELFGHPLCFWHHVRSGGTNNYGDAECCRWRGKYLAGDSTARRIIRTVLELDKIDIYDKNHCLYDLCGGPYCCEWVRSDGSNYEFICAGGMKVCGECAELHDKHKKSDSDDES